MILYLYLYIVHGRRFPDVPTTADLRVEVQVFQKLQTIIQSLIIHSRSSRAQDNETSAC